MDYVHHPTTRSEFDLLRISMWLVLSGFACVFLLGGSACTNRSDPNEYIRKMSPIAAHYNSARDVVDDAAAFDANPPATLAEAAEAATDWSARLAAALEEMNAAYAALSEMNVPRQYREHQQATLSAWRAGIEATATARLYFDDIAGRRLPDVSLVIEMNRLFGEEDRYQLRARNALSDDGPN